MIGHNNYSSSWPRRSYRRHYWALFVIFVFCLWQSGVITPGKTADTEAASEPLAQNTPSIVEEAIEPKLPLDLETNTFDSRLEPAQIVDLEVSYPVSSPASSAQSPGTPNQYIRLTADGKSANKANLAFADDTDGQDLDEIKRIGNHHDDEIVEHASKLTHPDDDDDNTSDADLNASQKDRQIQITDTKNDHGDGEEEEEGASELPQPKNSGEKQSAVGNTEEQTPWFKDYAFPSWDACQEVQDKADGLPDLLHVPFEVSVRDVVLEGWEDEWIAKAHYSGPKLQEPKIDFVYNWINGSQPELTKTMKPFELNSSLNDPEGVWMASHGSNRYREWDELRYSMRSVEKYAGHFTNRIQILVNTIENTKTDEASATTYEKQRPLWLRDDVDKVQVICQEEFFGPDERKCLPSFDSLTIENQLYNTKSEVDRMFALSDDMILGKPHSASDIYSPLFGPTLGFKTNAYNTLLPPTEKDAERFGEKPFLIYTSWLLNRRFGARKRKGQVHFGHSISRSISREAITSFPRPAMRSAHQRFRGETGFQLYSWYVIFHYTMERHREALLWSYIMLRSDTNDDGYLDWTERLKIQEDLAEGMGNESPEIFRQRVYYHVEDYLEQAGLKPPVVNTDILWTSLDGPEMIKDLDCDAFDMEDCLAPGFSTSSSDAEARSPVFSAAAIFDRVARQSPRCGDCLIKLVLNRRRAGLGPLLPDPVKKPKQREIVVKALMKYQYTVVNPDAMFYMVTDAEQAEHVLLNPYIKHGKKAGQICLNDDVITSDEKELEQLRTVMGNLFEGLLPDPSSYEI